MSFPETDTAFGESLRFLYSLGHELKAVKWDLARIRALLAELGNPHLASRFVHVAGTNGKGSTCAMIEAALRAEGFRTGLYTSPHLVDPRERIVVEGERISAAVWVDAFERVHRAAESLLAREGIDAHPSFFETVTAMAFVAFAEAELDIVVLETGLGGRLDATNVVDPELTVITPIDFDHEAFLGSSLTSIAGEKAGILKAGRPAVLAEQRPEALTVLEGKAMAVGAPVTRSSTWSVSDLERGRFESSFVLSSGNETIAVTCPLAGVHQVENARTAVTALRCLGVSVEAIQAGIGVTVWPGRLERFSGPPDIILDGAHNPAGARALGAHIREFFSTEPVRIIYGAMRDKAVEEVTETLFPLADEVILTSPNQPRALAPESLASWTDPSRTGQRCRIAADLPAALAMCAENPMTTFVTGSLYLVGEARALLAGE
jgi:dihydrofolate synthase/folylpolyglutamate synthase